MIPRAIGAVWLALAAGCLAPEPEETSEVEQHGRCDLNPDPWECGINSTLACGGCGHNGLREQSWDLLFGQFNRNTLKQHGLWIDAAPGVTDGARSLCDPNQTWANRCVMRVKYSEWIAGAPHSRVDIMTHVVAAIAQTDYSVKDPGPNGHTYWGSFNLRPQALTQTWDYRTQETITAALLAQLNAVPGVAICLLNEQAPNNCNNDAGKYHESDVYGNHFRYYFAGIAGGEHAPNPNLNLRFGNVRDGDVAFAYPYKNSQGAYQCSFGGAGGNRHATGCRGESGAWWDYPVTVRTPKPPGTWYYPPKSQVARPSDWPHVPIDY